MVLAVEVEIFPLEWPNPLSLMQSLFNWHGGWSHIYVVATHGVEVLVNPSTILTSF
jgi:hypothetical protein